MIYYLIPSHDGIDLPPVALQNSRVVDGVLHADDVCLGANVQVDNYKIDLGDKISANDAEIKKPWFGNNTNSLTWICWSKSGICKV